MQIKRILSRKIKGNNVKKHISYYKKTSLLINKTPTFYLTIGEVKIVTRSFIFDEIYKSVITTYLLPWEKKEVSIKSVCLVNLYKIFSKA